MDKRKYWFFGSKLNTVLLAVLIILMIVALRWMSENKQVYKPIISDSIPAIHQESQVEGNKDDLLSFSIVPGVEVHGLLSYRGSLKGGYFFEGNILVNILSLDKKVLKRSNAVAKSDWMTTEPVSFEGNIDFSGLPKGRAYFEIHNDNASGLPENDKSILIPIIIK